MLPVRAVVPAWAASVALVHCANLIGVRDLGSEPDASVPGSVDASSSERPGDDASGRTSDMSTEDSGSGQDGPHESGASDGSPSDAGGPDATDARADSTDASPPRDADVCDADTRSNAAHCGTCGHSCLGGTCSNGTCQPFVVFDVAHDGLFIEDVDVDGTSAYVTLTSVNAFDRPVVSVPKDARDAFVGSSGVTTIWNAADVPVCSVAVDDTDVYWLVPGVATRDDGAVWRAPKDGGPAVTIATAQRNPRVIALSPTDVFWGDPLNDPFEPVGIHAVAKSATSPSARRIDDTANVMHGMQVADGKVYWSDSNGIFACDVASCTPTLLAPVPEANFVVVGTRMFFGRFEVDTPIEVCDVAACDSTRTTFVDHQARVLVLRAFGDDLQWIVRGTPPTFTDAKMQSCPRTGCVGAPTVHANVAYTAGMRVDADSIWYWDSSYLRRVAR
ncbi:MAG: hypothetical protein U0169_22050 [Polyangiaceae bacterium]